MREILFRGKDIAKNWHYGSLHIQDGETDCEGKQCLEYRILGMRGECDYIILETVGQYTGRTDKNGKKIFEGDIVKVYSATGELDFKKAVIYWDELFSQWKANKSAVFGSDICATYEVIGNIHDNPELLKGGAE